MRAGPPTRGSSRSSPCAPGSGPTKAEIQFRAFCEGRTGVPIVDAGMRQLAQTGWTHNRVRRIVAMFLTKDLLIDWRWGERYFM